MGIDFSTMETHKQCKLSKKEKLPENAATSKYFSWCQSKSSGFNS